MKIKGINKYGVKLEDYSDYASYLKAYRNVRQRALRKTKKGIEAMARYALAVNCKLSKKKYNQSKKGKIQQSKKNKRYFKSEKGKIAVKKFYSTIKGKSLRRSIDAKYRASKLQRTPKWADLKAIRQFYANCPKGYEVDHIVPLQGVNVSGFHVLNNLQYLTKSENSSKSNKYAI